MRRPFKKSEDEAILRGRLAGDSYEVIAVELGRGKDSVRKRALSLGAVYKSRQPTYTKEIDEYIVHLRTVRKYHYREIANALVSKGLKLSPDAVRARAGKLGVRVTRHIGQTPSRHLKDPDDIKNPIHAKPREKVVTKPRKCLGAGCNRTFQSTGPGNRICGKCKDTENWKGGSDFSHPAIPWKASA